MTKKCRVCQIELEINSINFHKHKTGKDGFRNDCKPCFRKKSNKRYSNNKEAVAVRGKIYREKNKDLISLRGKKYREKNSDLIKERHFANKERNNEISRNYYAKNKSQVLETSTAWKKANKDRIKEYKKMNIERSRELERKRYRTDEGRRKAQMRRHSYFSRKHKLPNDLTLAQWEYCLEYFGHECAYCGSDKGTLEQEHFIPVTKKGAYSKENIIPACRRCNASKLNRDFGEWYSTYGANDAKKAARIAEYFATVEGLGKVEAE